MKYCVVLLTGDDCESYPGKTCVMEVKGPYGTRDEAVVIAGEYPDWTAPHIMMLNNRDERLVT